MPTDIRILSDSPDATAWIEVLGLDRRVTDGPVQGEGMLVVSRGESGGISPVVPDATSTTGEGMNLHTGTDAQLSVTNDEGLDRNAGRDVEVKQLVWQPRTLKEILNTVLKLALLTGRLPAAMEYIASEERKLKKLQDRIITARRKTNACPPTAAALVFDGRWFVAGCWVPDCIGRADGQSVWIEPGGRSAYVSEHSKSRPSAPDILFLSPANPDLNGDIFLQAARSLSERMGPECQVKISADAHWSSSGPVVYREIVRFARGLYPAIEIENEDGMRWTQIPLSG